jgi:CheY-like chemotaxis protein
MEGWLGLPSLGHTGVLAISMNEADKKLRRILIVDDEPAIAFEIQGALEDAGLGVAAVASSLEEALEFVRTHEIDQAVLDVNLRGSNSAPIATELNARGIPFVVMSAYPADQQPDVLRAAPLVTKPVDSDALIRILQSMAPASQSERHD